MAQDPKRGRLLASYPLKPDDPFPANYTVVMLLGERDDGGFAMMLERLWTEIAAEAKLVLMGSMHTAMGPIGVLIAELVHAVISGLLDFLASIFNNRDDLIGRVQGTLTLPSHDKSYFEGLEGREPSTPANVWASKMQTIEFKGDGGRYKAKFHWRVDKIA